MKALYHPLILLTHSKGGAKRGQHSASLDNVMEITRTRNRANHPANRSGWQTIGLIMKPGVRLNCPKTHS